MRSTVLTDRNAGMELTFIFNNNNGGVQVENFACLKKNVINKNIFFSITAESAEAVDVAETRYFYVLNNQGWDGVSLYTWGNDNEFFGGWPGTGTTGKTVTIKEKTYQQIPIPDAAVGQLVNAIFNNNGAGEQTPDLNIEAIVKAINDQTKSLEERFAILDASLKAGLTDVKVSVDKNTGAITLLDKNTNASLEKINGSLTNGFKLLKEQISTTGNDVIYALDNNGNLLRVELGKQQEALSATIVGQTTKLIAAINDQTSTLDKRIEALSTVVETGLKNVVISVDKNTGAITLLDKNTQASLNGINVSLDKIDGTLISGFQAIKTEISDTGGKIITALDSNGNLLRLELDKQQKLLSATIVAQTDKLAKAINDQTASLSSRFEALTTALSTGLANIKVEIDKNTGAIKTLDTNTQASLGTLNTTILNGFSTLNETVDKKGNKIVTAIGTQTDAIGTQTEAIKKQGKLLRTTITKSGKLIAAEIVGSINTLNFILASQNALLSSKLDAINTTIFG